MSSTGNEEATSSTGFKAPDDMESEKTTLRKRNDYDYDKMLEDFHLRDSIVKERKKRLKNLVEVNRQYKGQVQTMKNTIVQNEQDKIDKTKQEIEAKEKRHKTQQEINEIEREAKKKQLNRNGKGEKARKQHLIKLNEQEEFRLREAERTKYKMNLFTEISLEHKLEKHKNYEDKLRQSNEYHLRNLKVRDEEYERKLKERDERALQKYTSNYFAKKKRLEKTKVKKLNHQQHLGLVQEILEREEEKREKDRERFIEKLDRMTKQRKALEELNNAQCEKRMQELQRKFDKIKKNLKEAEKEENESRENTLEFQRIVIFRGKGKEDATLNNKYLARENTVLTQMETEKKINQFNRDINKILDQSIMKKSSEQRHQIYKDILKAEADKKKKELEEKKFNTK